MRGGEALDDAQPEEQGQEQSPCQGGTVAAPRTIRAIVGRGLAYALLMEEAAGAAPRQAT